MLKKAEDMGRMRRNMIMGAMVFVAAIVMIFVGRSQHRTGRSINEVGTREIERLREEGLREEAARKSAKS